jgi:hypothetical protein
MPNHQLYSPPPMGGFLAPEQSHTPAPYAAPHIAPGMITPQPRVNSGYELHDDGPHLGEDGNDMPLLRRDTGNSAVGSMPMPGGGFGLDDAVSDHNIRYGAIPQRVPRRYKTVKKVELVPLVSFFNSYSSLTNLVSQALPRKLRPRLGRADEAAEHVCSPHRTRVHAHAILRRHLRSK